MRTVRQHGCLSEKTSVRERDRQIRVRLALDQHTAFHQIVADVETRHLHVERRALLKKLQ